MQTGRPVWLPLDLPNAMLTHTAGNVPTGLAVWLQSASWHIGWLPLDLSKADITHDAGTALTRQAAHLWRNVAGEPIRHAAAGSVCREAGACGWVGQGAHPSPARCHLGLLIREHNPEGGGCMQDHRLPNCRIRARSC